MESDKMNKLYKLLLILLLIGTTSAAVYVVVNPEAIVCWARPEPVTNQTVRSLVECGEGYASHCTITTPMETNTLTRSLMHTNMFVDPYIGILYFEISCTTGLPDKMDGLQDFSSITYTCPNGITFDCNTDSCIERIDTNTIKITPTTDTYEYAYGATVYSSIEMVFVDGAYGDYCLTTYVDTAPIT